MGNIEVTPVWMSQYKLAFPQEGISQIGDTAPIELLVGTVYKELKIPWLSIVLFSLGGILLYKAIQNYQEMRRDQYNE